MRVHEYQAKTILARYGIPVPRGEVAFNAAEAGEIASRLGDGAVVVKAQIHAGGRGKGGGVKLARSREEAEAIADHMLGMTLVTRQTGSAGRVVRRVLIEEGVHIARELYLGLLLGPTLHRVGAGHVRLDARRIAPRRPFARDIQYTNMYHQIGPVSTGEPELKRWAIRALVEAARKPVHD